MPELNLTNEETAALDRIEAELTSSRAKTMAAEGGGVDDVCEKYRSLRSALLILIKILKRIPGVGPKAAAALEFLMSLADTVCPA
jgi:hypothetical protein